MKIPKYPIRNKIDPYEFVEGHKKKLAQNEQYLRSIGATGRANPEYWPVNPNTGDPLSERDIYDYSPWLKKGGNLRQQRSSRQRSGRIKSSNREPNYFEMLDRRQRSLRSRYPNVESLSDYATKKDLLSILNIPEINEKNYEDMVNLIAKYDTDFKFINKGGGEIPDVGIDYKLPNEKKQSTYSYRDKNGAMTIKSGKKPFSLSFRDFLKQNKFKNVVDPFTGNANAIRGQLENRNAFNKSANQVTILAPTGETITVDQGTAERLLNKDPALKII